MVTTLDSEHVGQHAVPLDAAWRVPVDFLSHHTELHGHAQIIPGLLNVIFLLSIRKREACRGAGVLEAVVDTRLCPPRRKQAFDSLGFADKCTECGLRRGLPVVDGADHELSIEDKHVSLAYALRIDEELEGHGPGAVVEPDVVGDRGVGLLVLISSLEARDDLGLVFVLIDPVLLGFRLGRSLGTLGFRSAIRLMGLPVSFLTILVAVGNEFAA